MTFLNLDPGRYEVKTYGQYGGQSDEIMFVVASDGDMDVIPDLDGSASQHSWLWGQGTVDMCESGGSILVRAYDQTSPALSSLTVKRATIEKIGAGNCLGPALEVSCSVSPTLADIGETVTWTATATSKNRGIHKYT